MEEKEVPNNKSPGHNLIVLTTDFGLTDPYVGVMKGVILGINPSVAVVDLTHQIQPQNILQASFTLATSYRFFPKEATHAIVVDPGVGTNRRAILLVTPHGRFIAPDNGVLSGVLGDYLGEMSPKPGIISLPTGLMAYSLTNPSYWLHPVSQTFHGRDVFAPVAAHLSMGVLPHDLGELIREIVWLPAPKPFRQGNAIDGEILMVDHFGNLVSNIPADMVSGLLAGMAVGDRSLRVEIKGIRISGLSRTFHDDMLTGASAASNNFVALLGSNGFLEVAFPDGNAASMLGVRAGEPLRVVGEG